MDVTATDVVLHMGEWYLGSLILLSAISVLTSIYVVVKRRMPGSITGGILIFFGGLWTLSYYLQLSVIFSEEIIFWFLVKSSVAYIVPSLFVLYIHEFFEFKIPKGLPLGLLTSPAVFTVLQLARNSASVVFKDLIIYNQAHVAPKYTPFGLIPIFHTYLISLFLMGYFIKTLMAQQEILKLRVSAFLAITTLYIVTFTADTFLLGPFPFEITPILVNFMGVGLALLNSERLYKRDILPPALKNLIEESEDLIIITDQMDSVLYLNEPAKQVSGHKDFKFRDLYIWDVFPTLLIESGERIQTLSTNERTYDIQSSLLNDWQDYNRSKAYVLRDITELMAYQYNLEDLVEQKSHELMHSERMAAIGETTLMVGHDLRNPLQVLKFLVHKLRNNSEPDPDVRQLLEKIDSNIIYMDKIISDLSLFAKNSDPETQHIMLIDVVERCISKLEVPSIVIIDYDFDFGFELHVDPYMFERVLYNLILNAIQAMPSGGVIHIEAEEQDGSKTIRVTDSGTGIPEELRENLFMPLSTTKPKSVGMGLAFCKKIVTLHSGDIHLDSDIIEGCSFVIELPESEKPQIFE